MAQGEVKWSSAGKQVTRLARTILPKNDYDLKINAADITQEKGEKPGQVPYINVPFEVLGTAADGGKNAKVFHRFFLHANANPKLQGKSMLDLSGGVLDFSKALGEDCSFSLIQVPYRQYDKDGNPKGEMTRIPIADPAAVLKWLKSKDGTVVRAHIVVDKSGVKNGYDPSNKVDYFIPSEDVGEGDGEEYNMDEEASAEEEQEEQSEEQELDDTEEAEEAEETEEDITSLFNKKAAAKSQPKPGPKVKQGPAGKKR